MKQVVTRFAPSPTGAAHAGSYRTAMFAWLFARHNNGKFILRIEDTNKEKNVPGSAEEIQSSLKWLGIEYDELYIQSQNLPRHQEILKQLIAEDKAYVSREEAKDGSGLKDLIRFRNPNKKVVINDIVRGEVVMDTTELEDFVIARTIDEPVYHLAVVVDDHDEGVTCVIRAEEHLSNTPRHILIMEALGFEIPEFAHLPLVLGPDKQKLSKRRGATAMYQYAEKGYLPEAVFNCVAMCGWNPGQGSEQEIFSREDLVSAFEFKNVQTSPAVFNEDKLDWFNREYIKKLTLEEQMDYVRPRLEQVAGYKEELLAKVAPHIIERISSFGEIADLLEQGEINYYFSAPVFNDENKKMLVWKTSTLEAATENLKKVLNLLETFSGDWNSYDELKNHLMPLAEEIGKGDVLWPLRVALCGKEKSPDPFTLLSILGKEESLERIKNLVQ